MLYELHKILKSNKCNYIESDDKVALTMLLSSSDDFYDIYTNLSELMSEYNNSVIIQNLDNPDLRRQFRIDDINEIDIFKTQHSESVLKNTDFSYEVIILKKELVKIIIEKMGLARLIDGVNVTVYFDLNYFRDRLLSEKPISKPEKYSIIILSNTEEIEFKNKWMYIVNDYNKINANEIETFVNNYDDNYKKIIIKQIRLRQSLSKIIGEHDETSPEYYYFQYPIGTVEVFSIIRDKFIKQVLLFISKETYVDKERIEYGLYGFKNITIQCINTSTIDVETYNKFYRFFDYIYLDYTDVKFEILPNVLSFYIINELDQFNQLTNNIDKIFNSVKSNFNIHAQERIRFWFDERKKIIDYISSKTDQISNLIDNHIKIFRNTIIALVITILGSVFQNASQSKVNFLKLTLLVYFYFGIVYYIYNFIISIVSFFMTLADFNHFVNNESRLLSKDEVRELIGNVISRKKYFYISTIVVSTFLYVILFYYIYYYYSHFELVRLVFMKMK